MRIEIIHFLPWKEGVDWCWENHLIFAPSSPASLDVRNHDVPETEDPEQEEPNHEVGLNVLNHCKGQESGSLRDENKELNKKIGVYEEILLRVVFLNIPHFHQWQRANQEVEEGRNSQQQQREKESAQVDPLVSLETDHQRDADCCEIGTLGTRNEQNPPNERDHKSEEDSQAPDRTPFKRNNNEHQGYLIESRVHQSQEGEAEFHVRNIFQLLVFGSAAVGYSQSHSHWKHSKSNQLETNRKLGSVIAEIVSFVRSWRRLLLKGRQPKIHSTHDDEGSAAAAWADSADDRASSTGTVRSDEVVELHDEELK